MSSDSKQQVPLEVSRGMLIAMLVVIGIGWLGGHGTHTSDGGRPGDSLAAWDIPDIVPILEPTARSESLGLEVDAVSGFAFFHVDRLKDSRGLSSISFVNRAQMIIGEIKSFDPLTDTWPPVADDFGQVVGVRGRDDLVVAKPSDDHPSINMGPLSDHRLQVQTILYGETEIIWASPRKSPAWPLRIHLGKCKLGPRTYIIAVYEMQAQSPNPDYTQGPIADLAAALHSL
ncbi:MAG: hypothetical protein KDB00_26205 [Planctomycetales bacterium]|nr:hypothetical protein [Planctomycetales bacterium]